MVPSGRGTAARGSHLVVAAAAYLLLALAQTWPLSLSLANRIPHDLGDPVLITYLINWNARAGPLTEAWWHAPFFWPAPNVIALSDPYLGVAPMAWLMDASGASPATIYNVLYIAAFWLSPLAMYVLVHFLTRDGLAAFIAGLAFGFAPFRASQLPHLQFLLVPGLPLVFFALHRAASSIRWAATAAALWLWQGLTALYLLSMLPVAIALWMVWFGGRNWRLWARVAAAFAIALVLAAVVIVRYQAVHREAGPARVYEEIKMFSADVTALAQSTSDLKFRLTSDVGNRPEQDLFPGFGITLLALIALAGVRVPPERVRFVTAAFLTVAIGTAITAAIAFVRPAAFNVLGVDVSLTSPHKSLAVAWISLLAALATSRTVTRGWNDGSLAIGYAAIALALWILALGPEPAFNGTPVWYRAPYWFLYQYVPGFDGLRVPARFWAIVTGCLAVLAGLGAERVLRGRWREVRALVICAMLVVEGWIAPIHLEPVPEPIGMPADAETVLEIPAGSPYQDSAAMYRSLWHGKPVLNGYSGYAPRGYQRLIDAVAQGDADAIVDAAHGSRLAVIFNQPLDASGALYQAIAARADHCQAEGAATICVLPALRR